MEENNVEHDGMRFDDENTERGPDAGGLEPPREAESGAFEPPLEGESEAPESTPADAGLLPGSMGEPEATPEPTEQVESWRLPPLEDETPSSMPAEPPSAMTDWTMPTVLTDFTKPSTAKDFTKPLTEAIEPEPERRPRVRLSRRHWAILVTTAVVIGVVVLGAIYVVPVLKQDNWRGSRALAIYIAIAVLAVSGGLCLLLRKTLRTRLAVWRELRDDPDINDWLVVFDWTQKVLYVPTIAAAFIASALMYLEQGQVWFFAQLDPAAVGGIWFGLFFLNFLVEEYSVSIKVLLIAVVGSACFLLWLNLLEQVGAFFRLFTNLAISVSGTGFLLIGVFGLLTIAISWIKGLFYYVTLTPNYMNVQEGPTESGEQVGREDYNSRIDTSDFMERMMGFGRIVITFKDQKRQPITLLVWRIKKKAKYLERVRGKIAIDQYIADK